MNTGEKALTKGAGYCKIQDWGSLEKQPIPSHFIKEINERKTVLRKVSVVLMEVIIRNIFAGLFAKHYGVEKGSCSDQSVLSGIARQSEGINL